MILFDKHPIIVFKSILQMISIGDIEFEFSKYVYKIQGVTEKRTTINLPAKKLSEEWLTDMVTSLDNNEELACHSKVIYDENTWHIPFIDFVVTNKKEIPDEALKAISKKLKCNVFIFLSGTSFHGYFDTIVLREDWLSFLGEILLLNNSRNYKYDIIDSRWVGHALQQGFAALRWSNKTKRAMPTLVS